MQSVKNLPLILLTLLAGCTEQPPVVAELPVPVEESPTLVTDIVENNEAEPIEVVETEVAQRLYKVTKIIDGDTIDVLSDDKETIRLRFNGIDTPEPHQQFCLGFQHPVPVNVLVVVNQASDRLDKSGHPGDSSGCVR